MENTTTAPTMSQGSNGSNGSNSNGNAAQIKRYGLDEMGFGVGKKARLHRLLYQHGPGNGTMLLLPIDQGLEHGPIDFLVNPDALDPEFQLRVALDGGYSGIVYQVGIANKYMMKYAGRVPLVLKLNGKTNFPNDDAPFSPQLGSVQDAVYLGADAVGYTLYVGSSRQDDDFRQIWKVREDCEKYGMPLIVWSYPRGSAVKSKGGQDSLYAVDYAARAALEVGADIIKVNVPTFKYNMQNEKEAAAFNAMPKEYQALQEDYSSAIRRVILSAGRGMVLFSGGSKVGDDDLLEKASQSMAGGAAGLIFGRNIWQRSYDEAISMSRRIKEIMMQYPFTGDDNLLANNSK